MIPKIQTTWLLLLLKHLNGATSAVGNIISYIWTPRQTLHPISPSTSPLSLATTFISDQRNVRWILYISVFNKNLFNNSQFLSTYWISGPMISLLLDWEPLSYHRQPALTLVKICLTLPKTISQILCTLHMCKITNNSRQSQKQESNRMNSSMRYISICHTHFYLLDLKRWIWNFLKALISL